MTRPDDRYPRPPYDPAIEPDLETRLRMMGHGPYRYELDIIRREGSDRTRLQAEALYSSKNLRIENITIPGPRQKELALTIVRPKTDPWGSKLRPAIFYIHGGALISCNRYAGLDTSAVWAAELDAITISVEYGLAPEHTGLQPAEDCYAALLWVERNLGQLGIDPCRLLLHGPSAGGGLAAATALMVRDKGGPSLCGLSLECPMLDDRNHTISAQQYATGPFYNSIQNRFAWRCLLGDRVGTDAVSEYEAPGRATDLTGLPPTFLDCASAEPFRDEIVQFAAKLWADGGIAELHVWHGGPHGYDRIVPKAPFAIRAREARLDFLRRTFKITSP